jgi:hypothetical protein
MTLSCASRALVTGATVSPLLRDGRVRGAECLRAERGRAQEISGERVAAIVDARVLAEGGGVKSGLAVRGGGGGARQDHECAHGALAAARAAELLRDEGMM